MARQRREIPAWALGLDAHQIAYYDELPLARARCRGSGRHRFHLNDLEMRGDRLPEGMEIIPLADGTCEVRDWCMRGCDRYQSYLTDQDGTILWDTRDYGGDRSYIATGLGLTRSNDVRFLRYNQQFALAGAIAKRIKIARRAVTDIHVAGEAV